MALKASQRSLKKWSSQEWDYINPKDKGQASCTDVAGTCLKNVRETLSPYQKAQENKRKRKASSKGKQRASYSKGVARKVRRAT